MTAFRAAGWMACAVMAWGAWGCGSPTKQQSADSISSTTSEADALHFDEAYSKRVARGFAISPVPVNTDGLDGRQRKRVGYGSYLVNTSGCGSCHSGQAGFLAGGNPFFLDQTGHVVWSRNLTSDPATGLQLTEDQFIEALRTGRDFHPNSDGMMLVMPWQYFRWMSDSDLRAIYAYLRAIPATSNFVPPDDKAGMHLPPEIPFPHIYNDGDVERPLPWIDDRMSTFRGLAIQPLAQPRIPWWKLRAFGRGSYLVNAVIGCAECHTNPARTPAGKIDTANYLTGGQVYLDPPPLSPHNHQVRSMTADLIGAVHGFLNEPGMDYATFREILTSDTHADDDPPTPLAWPMSDVGVGKLVPQDLHAIWVYLKSLPANTTADKETRDAVSWCATDADCGDGASCAFNPADGANECVGQACSEDADCGACDSCDQGACQPLPPGDACYTQGI